ncbi:MAG: hypothetical protein BGO41_01005 [Clostridiales bacterium 38-18]|nr:MAG: hypothetical protein BGO41_01005 [Clostridiales bacterium 38-18]
MAPWQEAYMEKLVGEYLDILNEKSNASTKFWALEKKIKIDKNKPGVILNLRKSEMIYDVIHLIRDGAITFDDLSDFSDDLKHEVRMFFDKLR